MMRIGFFDSGMGGLTVLKRAIETFPQQDYVYYADSSNAPYGVKSKEEVLACCHQAVQFLMSQGVELVVIACNTATSIAVNDLRATYSIPIIGIEPAVKPAIEAVKETGGRVLVTATPLTIKEEKLKGLLKACGGFDCCDLLPLPRLVEWAEQGEFSLDRVVPYLKQQLDGYPVSSYHRVVLGCTHFPLFKRAFSEVFGSSVQLVDGAMGVVKRMAMFIPTVDHQREGVGTYVFYRNSERLKESELSVYFEQLND